MSKWPKKIVVWLDGRGGDRWRRVHNAADERDVVATYNDVRIYALVEPRKPARKRKKAKR